MDSKRERMWKSAYTSRSPLFGEMPTDCVKELTKLLKRGAKVLDLGCGDGRDTLFMLKHGFSVVAVDAVDVAIERLKHRAAAHRVDDRLQVHILDVMELPLPEAEYDAVVGVTILDHLYEDQRSQLLDRIKQGVRPGGYIAVEMHSDRDPAWQSRSSVDTVSEFSDAIVSVSHSNFLPGEFMDGWRILLYSDRLEQDLDHGEPHIHGFCTLLCTKEVDRK